MLAVVFFSFGLLWVLFEVWYVVLWWSLYRAYWSFFTPFPVTFCFALHVSSISVSERGLKKAYLGHLPNLKHSGERKVICSDYCFFLLRRICTSLLAFLFRPILCKKSNFFMLNAIKIILITDENVLQFYLNIRKANMMVSFPLSLSITCWKAFGMNYN